MKIVLSYNPRDWYWSGTPGVYGSARGGLVSSPSTDADYLAWKARGNPVPNVAYPWPHDSTAELDAVLEAAGLPPTGMTAPTMTQLRSYTGAKIATLLATPRSYTVAGLSGPVVDDCGAQTGLDMTTAWGQLATATYPFLWSNNNYAVWSMTQVQLTAFLTAAFAYASSVWALANGTVFPGITSSAITTYAQIDAEAWPA